MLTRSPNPNPLKTPFSTRETRRGWPESTASSTRCSPTGQRGWNFSYLSGLQNGMLDDTRLVGHHEEET